MRKKSIANHRDIVYFQIHKKCKKMHLLQQNNPFNMSYDSPMACVCIFGCIYMRAYVPDALDK